MSIFSDRHAKNSDPAKLAKLAKVAASNRYHIEFVGTVYKGGWPEASSRPYRLSFADGSPLAAYASIEALEKALNKRIAD
jgi:hypothetical protein